MGSVTVGQEALSLQVLSARGQGYVPLADCPILSVYHRAQYIIGAS